MRMGRGEGGKGDYMEKTYPRTLVVAGVSSFRCFWTRVWAAKIVVSAGLRGERRTGRSLVLACGSTGAQCELGCLRTNVAQARVARDIPSCNRLLSKATKG